MEYKFESIILCIHDVVFLVRKYFSTNQTDLLLTNGRLTTTRNSHINPATDYRDFYFGKDTDLVLSNSV